MGKKPEKPDVAKLRRDGKTDNFYGPKKGAHGHTVVKSDGSVSYLRTRDGKVHVDDRKKK